MRERRRRRDLLIAEAISGVALVALGLGVYGAGIFHMFASVQKEPE